MLDSVAYPADGLVLTDVNHRGMKNMATAANSSITAIQRAILLLLKGCVWSKTAPEAPDPLAIHKATSLMWKPSSAVTINIANRAIALLGGVLLLAVIAMQLTPALRGFYFTFYSLSFLRFFAELGLSTAVVQIISNQSSRPETEAKLASTTRFFVIWFGISAFVLAALISPAIFLFSVRIADVENGTSRIVLPWIAFSVSIGLSIFLMGIISIVEGHRKILEVSKIKLKVSVTNFLLAAVFFMLGFELWSLPIAAFGSVVVGGLALLKHHELISWTKHRDVLIKTNWLVEIWPFQWRLAMSWISGFFMFYFLTPFVMWSHGPEAAGQVGFSLQIIQIMNSISVMFISTYFAVFSGFVATGKIAELMVALRRSTIQSTLFLVLMIALFWLCYWQLPAVGLGELRERMIPADQMAVLMISTIGTHAFFVVHYYLRSFKDEGLWWLSLVNGLTTVALCLLLVPSGTVWTALVIYTASSLVYWLLLAPLLAHRRARRLITLSLKDVADA